MNFFDDNIEDKIQKEQEQRQTHTLWAEKYRPITMETFIGNDLVKEKANEFIQKNDLPHLLFHGRAGGGKTTLAKLLAMNLNCDTKYINASDENSVDDVRTKVKGFASTTGFKDLKILILDEADYLTPNAQAALRNLMETFSKDTRFILTCNYPEKIIDPIISRCQVFELIPPSKKDIAKHLARILSMESVKFEPTDLAFLVNAYYPDIRKILNNAQMQSVDGALKINQKAIIDSDYKLKILEILKEKSKDKKASFKDIRQLLADNSVSDFTDVYKLLYDSIDDYALGSIAPVILILSEMEYKSAFVVDKEISFMSAVIQILDKIK